MKDYYKILELKQSASLDEIKKAYRTLSKRYHPDVNKHGIEQFKAINEANSVLSDSVKRKAYDMQYNTYFKPKNTQQTTPSYSKQPTSNTSNSSTSSTIIVNGVKINITGKNTSTNIRVVNGKVIVEATYH
jgi:curved DNA-binding protein CbpA